MTKLQEKKEIDSLKEYFKKTLSTKENSRKFFKELGSHDDNGRLTRNYK